MKKQRCVMMLMLAMGACVLAGKPVMAQDASPVHENAPTMTVADAAMCESVQDGLPVNKTIVFEVSKATAYCWSKFDPVISDGIIFHEWYRKGKLISRKKLAVHTPKWATYSSLTLREADIGPWQLKIVDEDGTNLKTLRFSITK